MPLSTCEADSDSLKVRSVPFFTCQFFKPSRRTELCDSALDAGLASFTTLVPPQHFEYALSYVCLTPGWFLLVAGVFVLTPTWFDSLHLIYYIAFRNASCGYRLPFVWNLVSLVSSACQLNVMSVPVCRAQLCRYLVFLGQFVPRYPV